MNYKNINKQSGFTIVELLIVVVVIAILAAITMVSYAGITQKANTSASQSNASTVIKKAELYAADEANGGEYPTTLNDLTSADATEIYSLNGSNITVDSTVFSSGNLPTSTSQINFYTCDSGAGVKVNYWNYSTSQVGTLSAGVVSGTCTLATT